MFDNLLMMFDTLHAAKSLTVSAYVVRLLTLFAVNRRCSPFRDLKFLKLDFTDDNKDNDDDENGLFVLVPGVKAYFLHKLRRAKCTIINKTKIDPSGSPTSCSEPTQTHG
ncbi:hypothetical protein QVD17_17656 [Tagetes erecta]|uniref:Uncharacterized protein n=1 Tax=Tagetes erecta TaxID=13708 RepID=A0AAD8KX43_TARER|nr:hypothetical protein QVD17_17656 [Tagetes erecta]